MYRYLLVTLSVLSLLLAGLAAPSPVSAANPFALPEIASFAFTENSTRYEIYLTLEDLLISIRAVFCNGEIWDFAFVNPTDDMILDGGDDVLFSVTTVWDTLGTITHESGACGDGASGEKPFVPAPNHHKQTARTDDAGSLNLPAPKNGSMTFPAGTCSDKCSITPSLPSGAASSLPADVVATMYVRFGGDGEGAYTVCFDVGDLTSPVIYRYLGGVWVAQAVTVSGGQVCTSASGDGVFALGGS